jgi:predicted SprT family Zn-dependent metalloprotease
MAIVPLSVSSAVSGYTVDEIAMNPVYFSIRTIKATLSTLVHEMVHQWQFHFGEPGRRGYHNKQWAARMERVGLMPSDTGEPGGRKVGQSMTHYIIAGGLSIWPVMNC